MKASPAEVMAQLLVDQGAASAWPPAGPKEWGVRVANLPAEDRRVVAVYDTTPVIDGRDMGTGAYQKHYGVQIRLRAPDYQAGWRKGRDIEGVLEAVHNVTVTTYTGTPDQESWTVCAFCITAPLTFVRQEEKDRAQMFVINGTVTLAEA